tara:strand:+ start:1022 stop:2140 length:1119 start_codon:yes stop_codon:yes gene_type:complete
MKILNKYTYLLIGLVLTATLIVFIILPRFETQEFDPDRVESTVEGLVPTSTIVDGNSPEEEESVDATSELIEIEKSETEKILINNISTKEITGYKSYLLIGSDERDENSSESRGFVNGQRADVIIVGLIDEAGNDHYLLSIPRDTLIVNTCTKKLERINGSYSTNNCGNNAENLAAAVKNITGIRVDHFASFNFEGFENIIDSFNGIEICVEVSQKEGYTFELQKGCQIVSGSTALNWVVSRNTEVLVGEKILDENGEDASEWKKMDGVSDLSRNERQQYVILQLLKRLNDFQSLGEFNNFINTLEESFIIDENLTLSTAINTLWNLKDIDFSRIKTASIPTYPYELKDGRQVLIISENFSAYAEQIGLAGS